MYTHSHASKARLVARVPSRAAASSLLADESGGKGATSTVSHVEARVLESVATTGGERCEIREVLINRAEGCLRLMAE